MDLRNWIRSIYIAVRTIHLQFYAAWRTKTMNAEALERSKNIPAQIAGFQKAPEIEKSNN